MARDAEIDIVANDKTSKGVNSARKNMEGLEKDTHKILKRIGDLPLGAIGGQLGNSLAKSVAKGLAPVAEYAVPILGAIGVGAAPFIAASISGAILGGVGIGIAGIGLAVAAQDARVQAAFKGVGESLKKRLFDAGGAFVEPAIDGINTIKKAIDTIDIEGLFRNSARFVQPLADGVAKAMESLGNGIESLVANAGPSIDAIADGIAGIGKAVGDGLTSLSDNAESSASALRLLFGIISTSITYVSTMVNVLTELYEIGQKIGADTAFRLFLKGMGADLDAVGENGRKAGSGTFGAAGGIQAAGDAASAAAAPIKTVAEQLHDAADAGRSLYDSQTSAAEALKRATDAFKENGKTLSTNTAKGRENRTALSNLASALTRQYEETVKVNGAGRVADQVATANRASFIKLATQLTGSASKARALADQLLGIPKKTDTKATLNKTSASAAAAAYKKQLDNIPRSITTVVTIARRVTGSTASDSAIKSALNKQNFSSSQYFAESPGSNKGVRAEPTLSATIENTFYLDGELIQPRINSTIKRSQEYQNHKLTVGRVY